MPGDKTIKQRPNLKPPWRPGQSGNPNGRPKGARNMATRAVEALLDGEAEALSRKAIDLALEGNTTALRLCLERIAPPRKGSPVTIDLPGQIETAKDIQAALASVLKAVGEGEISPDEGSTVSTILETKRKAIETVEFEERIAVLEKKTQ